ncbi:MAG: CDP-diacylglycerol--serine O-phosphatidyltransferase [Pseudomonadales bacterium]|nr:CDP-diacylglycerol--serine O-phosphatidyltransferase [Pseudomonadales bacterium]
MTDEPQDSTPKRKLFAVDGDQSPDSATGENDEYGSTDGLAKAFVEDEASTSPTQKRSERRARIRQRGIYLLPNLITTGALFAGFYAMIAAMNGDYVAASLAVFVAMALDTADGRVARLTRTESAFGAEYDSLSDMVAFGVAPALVAFSWGLSTLGQIGWVATFVYMACAALRLARFNTKGENTSFTGLASPSAAAIIACCVWVWVDSGAGAPGIVAAAVMGVVTVITALLMVSNFEYYSPKLLGVKGRVPFVTLVFVVFGFSLLLLHPPTVLLVLFCAYALSGPVKYLWELRNSETKTDSN